MVITMSMIQVVQKMLLLQLIKYHHINTIQVLMVINFSQVTVLLLLDMVVQVVILQQYFLWITKVVDNHTTTYHHTML